MTDPIPDDAPSAETLARDLREARADYADLQERIERHGEESVACVADAVQTAERLLDRYRDSATGSGDFEAYVTFQGEFAELVEGLPEDVPEREAFEAANEVVDQRRLSERDFDDAGEAIEPAKAVGDLLAEREAAAERIDDAERAVNRRLVAIEERIDHLEQLRRLGEADLDAPTEELTDPIARYDDAVAEAFHRFRSEAPASDVIEFVAATTAYPLIDFEQPPAELETYLNEYPIGDEPVSTLLTYADYSQSKLDHYVEDTTEFRTTVPIHRTYLDRLDAEPLTVGSPPPTADRLRYLAEELIPVVGRFADEATVALARDVRDLTFREDYGRLRRAAVAEVELSAAARERLKSGAVAEELSDLRDDADRLRQALDGE